MAHVHFLKHFWNQVFEGSQTWLHPSPEVIEVVAGCLQRAMTEVFRFQDGPVDPSLIQAGTHALPISPQWLAVDLCFALLSRLDWVHPH
jgi:hypothetical protein